MEGLYKLQKRDINHCTEILSKSFSQYPMFLHIIGEQSDGVKTKVFLKFLIKYSVLYAEAYATSENLEGVILYTDIRNYNFSLVRSLRSGALTLSKLGADAGKRFNAFNDLTSNIHNGIIKDPHQYVIMLGVDPSKQGQGHGTNLMQHILDVTKEKGQPCFLETHGKKNVTFYEKLGFKVVSEDLIPDTDIVQYAMLKE